MVERLPCTLQIMIASFVVVMSALGLITQEGDPGAFQAIQLTGLIIALPAMIYLIVRLALVHHSK